MFERFCFWCSLKSGSINLGALLVILGLIGMGLFSWAMEKKEQVAVVSYWAGCEQVEDEIEEKEVVVDEEDTSKDHNVTALIVIIILFLFSISNIATGVCLIFGAINETPGLLLPFLIVTPLNLILEILLRIIYMLMTHSVMRLAWGPLVFLGFLIIFLCFWLCIFCFWKKMKKSIHIEDMI